MRRRNLNCSIAMFVAAAMGLFVGACSSSSGHVASGATLPSTSAPSTTTPPHTFHVHFTGEGPNPTLLTPLCQDQHCVIPATETGSFHGDLEGKHLVSGGSVANGLHFVSARAELFIGTVKGCGQGTFVMTGTEYATPQSGTGDEDIAVGYGTGALAHLSGHVHGSGGSSASGIRSTFEGDLSCG